jgi:hypothetical protein
MRRIVLLCLVLAGCSGRSPHGLWTDPSLDSDRLAEGVIVGGIVDLTLERDVYAVQRDADLLEEVLLQERPQLVVVPWGEVRATLGPDSLDTILSAYRLTGRLSAAQLRSLWPLTGHGRYLALARIDLDQTSHEYRRQVRETTGRTVVDLEPESRRKISLLFDLYDVQQSKLVYTLPVERTGIEHGATFTVEGMDAVPTETEIRDAVYELERSGDRPEPANRKDLLRGILREAIRHLP